MIPPQSYVNLRIENWDLTSSARVRYSRRAGATIVVGLELTQKVHQQMLDSLRETPSRLIENSNQSHQKNRTQRCAGSYYTD